jgi:hypothetical protein
MGIAHRNISDGHRPSNNQRWASPIEISASPIEISAMDIAHRNMTQNKKRPSIAARSHENT